VGWAAAKHLPTAIQEQNSYPGLTTRWLAPYVDQLHLGYEDAMKNLWPGPDTEVRIHGNPIAWPDPLPDPDEVRRDLGLAPGRTVLVIGGSQGSLALNEAFITAIEAVNAGELPPLPPDVQILWSTGPAHHADVSQRIGLTGDRVAVRTMPYISEIERALSLTTLAVSRAGALAVSELCAWGIPSVLVPLPHAAAGHQLRNAQSLEAAGAAVVLEEAHMSNQPTRLWRTVVELMGEPWELEEMGRASLARGNPNAADEIATDLWKLLEGR
jgi:UDP-N-acetylglucosamine--N-acetylmuramyl-(pentapeptide) pyrophosphoryl-undecaprenol N-acetylglucosamine transferase